MEWTHNICGKCWNARNPDRPAYTIVQPEENICCFCGELNRDGIYVRHDPRTLTCRHEDNGSLG